MPTSFADEIQANFESDLQRARGYKPVTRREMRQAYAQYKKVGLKFGTVKKRYTDEQLYNKAVKTVLKWWKLQKKEKIEAKRTNAVARQQRAEARDKNQGAQSNWAGGSGGQEWTQPGRGGAYYGGTSGGARSRGGMPDTALGTRDDTPDRYLTFKESQAIMRSRGIPLTWKPPMQATRSEKALNAWIERAALNHDLILRRNGALAYLNRGAVAEVARRYGVTVDPRSVPIRYRTSMLALQRYMTMIKKAQAMQRATSLHQIGDAPTPTRALVDRTRASYLVKMRSMPLG